ncbi:hypothetical protein P691DRAFT_766581 [Macrolepiota fuliginosa MF-IS2]|uniref:Uncharacterized protein n=1 Tax=Macrolepiota fuliginosa MF-IS2 TaxID=1400762 RepID=A0A9P6BVX0_9AGAR|nr:hypothetical protein P691DRAFT_766581 [Macrolepiota fuliginosa MF-IS2]
MDEEPEFTTSPAASSKFFASDGEDDDDIGEDEDDLEVDHPESPPASRPVSPGPETSTDGSISLRVFFSMRRLSFVIDDDDDDDEDDRALALAAGFSPAPSIHLPLDENGDLPPLDDWYLGASARTLVSAVAAV